MATFDESSKAVARRAISIDLRPVNPLKAALV